MHRLSQGAIMRTELLMCFVLRITSGPSAKFVNSKSALTTRPHPPNIPSPPPVVYATDRSKAVVLVFFLFCGFVVYTTGRFI